MKKPGIYFEEVYAHVARLKEIIIFVSKITYKGWKIHHLDVKSTFMNGRLEEEVYVSQPPGFEIKGQDSKV